MSVRTAILLLLAVATSSSAAEWEPVTGDLLTREKPGFGGLCGVIVDRLNGDVYVNVSDRGLYVSHDQGKTWERPKGIPLFKGRTETPGCISFDPMTRSHDLLAALVYGGPVSIFKNDSTHQIFDRKSSHVDWCAIDWTDTDHKFALALKHESGGTLLITRDGGKTFVEAGKGFGPAWVFDQETAVAAQAKTKDNPKPGLLRTVDAGKTWKPCGDYTAQTMPRWFDGKLYWIGNGALICTKDKGVSWQKICDMKDGRFGPIFGKTAAHLFVLTQAGIIESTDGGATWSKPIAVPKEMKGVSTMTWLAYDPLHDVLYTSKMGSELYKLARK